MAEPQVLFLTAAQGVGQPPARGRGPRQHSAYKDFHWFGTSLTGVRSRDMVFDPSPHSFLVCVPHKGIAEMANVKSSISASIVIIV